MLQTPVPPPPRYLFTLARTPVKADLSAPLNVFGSLGLCWLLVNQRYPGRGMVVRLVLSVVWTGLLMAVFIIHSLGHIFSARFVGGPMDMLLVNAVQWITFYHDNEVSPGVHLGRASGGPLANLFGIVIVGALRALVPPGMFGRDLLDAFAQFNAAIGSAALLPTPAFDGGALVKWTVYEWTGEYERAAYTVRQAGFAASVVLGGLAGITFLFRQRLSGMILAAFSFVTALESLRRD